MDPEISSPTSSLHPVKGPKWRNEGERYGCTLVSPFHKDKENTMTTLIHHCEGGKEGKESRCGWSGWREWAAPAVTSHYSTKQVPSSCIFQLQQQNADDRSFGYSSLEVHMANMIMNVTDMIKVTFTDGGWQHLFCSLNPSSSLFSTPIN